MPSPSTASNGALFRLIAITLNLRVSIVCVGPILLDVSADLDLSSAMAGLLLGLPLLAFAVFSPVAPALAARWGLDSTIRLALVVLAVAIVVRSLPVGSFIWIGTIVLGLAIATLNVLIPAQVSRDFPTRMSPMTGVYTATQGSAAAVGAVLAVPLAATLPGGWRSALAVWAVFAVFAAAVPPRRQGLAVDTPHVVGSTPRGRSPWRTALGWQVTLFMGLQSMAFYVYMAWVPTFERAHGVPEAVAGVHLGIFYVVSVCSSITTGRLLHRLADQKLAALVVSGLILCTFLGLVVAPGLSAIWSVIGGAACGSMMVVALSLFGYRTSSHEEAARLSGMAQSVGYAIAGVGPVVFGAIFDWSASWTLPLLLTAAAMVAMAVIGVLAGRDRVLG